jgi:hypothetical protein
MKKNVRFLLAVMITAVFLLLGACSMEEPTSGGSETKKEDDQLV